MSGFCNSLLGKDIYDIKENDLINFFKNEQEETNTLEFKSGDVEIQKLCKEICAFLNTEGGLIIIGTPTEKKKNIGKNTYNICQGKLTSSRFSDKDWLYKKIYSRITPVPTNLKIQEIKNERSKYFVIEVNQSSNPPHQLDAEGRYYIRIEREAKPAPHGIVEALFNRRQKPQPRVNYYTDNITDYKQKIDISIFNDSNVTAENISGYLEVYGLRNIIINDPSKENIIKYTNNIYKIRLPLINYLIKGLENNTSIVVEHNKNPYLIKIVLWCKHSELYEKSVIYSPIKNKVLEKFVTGDEREITDNELTKKVDELCENKERFKPLLIDANCNFLTINAKDNLENIITVKNAHTLSIDNYSEKYIKVPIYDNSGSFGKCFVEKEAEIAKLFYNNPNGSFIGQIQNEPEMYSFIITDIIFYT